MQKIKYIFLSLLISISLAATANASLLGPSGAGGVGGGGLLSPGLWQPTLSNTGTIPTNSFDVGSAAQSVPNGYFSNLILTGSSGSGTRCLQVDNTGAVAIAAGACGTTAANFSYLFPNNATNTQLTFNGGLLIPNDTSLTFLGGPSGCTNTTGLKTGSDGTFLFDAGCSVKFKGGSGQTQGFTDGSFNYVWQNDVNGNTTQSGRMTAVYASTTMMTSDMVYKYSPWQMSTTTGNWTGTSTRQDGLQYSPILAEKFVGAQCYTIVSGSTMNIQFYQGELPLDMIPASSTPAYYTFTTNNSIAAGATTTAVGGTPTNGARGWSCTLKRIVPMK